MANTHDPITEARLVHEGVQAVAARCDGAISDDGVGFDGGDTAYGRRIASMPFEKLTADDHFEIARIANKYQRQILAHTGMDVTTLAIVQAAKGGETNHTSRQNARRFEKLSAVRAARKVTLLANGQVGVSWGRDPDFSDLVAGAQKLPGRWYNRQTTTNEVDASDELLAFADHWDMEVPAEVIAAVEAKRPQVAQAAAVEAARPQVGLDRDGRIVVSQTVTEDAAVRSLVVALPGRRWSGTNNVVDASPEAAALFARLGLRLTDNATRALAGTGDVVEAPSAATQATQTSLLAQASRAGSVADLPAEFIALVRQATGA